MKDQTYIDGGKKFWLRICQSIIVGIVLIIFSLSSSAYNGGK